MAEKKKIVGFRRVRGRVVPISGHIAGNAGAAAIVAGGLGAYLSQGTKKEIKKIRENNRRNLVFRQKIRTLHEDMLEHRKSKLMSANEFLHYRNEAAPLNQIYQNNKTLNRRWLKMVAKNAREAKFFKRVAVGLGAISLGALAYQKVKNAKR